MSDSTNVQDDKNKAVENDEEISSINPLDKKIGTKEGERLAAKNVIVKDVRIEDQYKKATNVLVGKMVHVDVKHPDKEELVSLTKCLYLKGRTVTESGLWYNEDSDGNIQKGSALSSVLKHYKAPTLRALLEMELETEPNAAGYICIKAF